MKLSSIFNVLLCSLFTTLISAQLPRQIKPKVRGFPGKHQSHDHHGVGGRGVIEPMYRLNNTFLPSRYDIEVRVILDDDKLAGTQFTAPGKVRIVGVNQENTSRIVLHAKELSINQSSVSVVSTVDPGQRVEISKFSEDPLRDFFIIELSSEIRAGEELEIYIEHVANMSTRDIGLFYKTYESEDGEIKRLAATQFQSVDARRMFPCFDEPDLKAVFQMTVIRRENYTSLSNTELLESVPDPAYLGWVIDKFAPTVKMSTYLLATIVSDYDYSEAFFGSKSARTYAPRALIEAGAGNYSANVAAACLNFYESYFNESYKLSKMDSVAVPEFSGAMENYGLNVYGTSYLMFLPDEQSESERNMVTLIIAHELAHQWFGNLVTMKWWSELYLNEGFSTYTQYLGMEAASPDLRGIEYAILDAFQYSMLYDARPDTHPLSYNVTTPDEIEGMFSTISYEKGASIVRMMDGFLTRQTLQKGLQSYLKRSAYTGVEQDDLFEILQEAAVSDGRLPDGLTVPKIMHTWTDQPGFPVVKVDIANDTHVLFTQERFKNHNAEDLEELQWYIPITVLTAERSLLENNVPTLWLESDGTPKPLSHNTSTWIMINNNATGFYRTLYAKPLADLIKKQLESNASVISPLSRSQLLDDYFIFAKQKYVNIQAALNFTTFLQQESHFAVWSSFFEHFASFHDKFSSHPGYSLLQAYLRPKVDAALISVGLEELSTHTGALAILRADLLDWSCSLQSPLCREYALKLFAQWQADSNHTSPIKSADARATLQCAIVATGGRAAFDFIFDKYNKTDDSDTREALLNALACATDTDILQELLNKTLQTSGLHPSDAILALGKVAANPFGRAVIIKFLAQNIDAIIDKIGNGHARPIGVVLGTLSTYYTTQSQLDEVKGFVDANRDKLTSISASIKAVLGIIGDNISWMNSVGFDVWMWLWFQ